MRAAMIGFQTRGLGKYEKIRTSAIVLCPWCAAKPVAQLFVQGAVELDMLEPFFVMLTGRACAERCSAMRAEVAKVGGRNGHGDSAGWPEVSLTARPRHRSLRSAQAATRSWGSCLSLVVERDYLDLRARGRGF
jgi:hypothetical protein